jgi:hypothetical protein
MDEQDRFQLSPPWKHALKTLLQRGLPYGSVIERAELVALFGMREPVTAEDQRRFDFEWLEHFEPLRSELLEEHRLHLRTLWGKGAYEVTEPEKQTGLAMQEGAHDLRKALRRMARTLAFVRHEELTEEQRAQNADAQAKAAMLAGMLRKHLKGPP